MFFSRKEEEDVFELFEEIGIKQSADHANTAMIKVNIARPPTKGHPRTCPILISRIVKYLSLSNIECTIAECADGYLEENIRSVGLDSLVKKHGVNLLDLDFEEVAIIKNDDEDHYLPKCLTDYDLRIGIPATSKRPNMIFSNNIKLFVGAVPRRYYQIGEPVRWRPKIHIDLHKSVTNIYRAVMEFAPFHFFINGGLSMDETKGEFKIPEILAGDDGLELDLHVIKKYFDIELPDYLKRLVKDYNLR